MVKVAVIGCTHAGTQATVSMLRDHPDWSVDVFERNDTISFISAAIAPWVGGEVSDTTEMFCFSPEQLKKLGARMHMLTEVVDVNINESSLTAKDMRTGKTTRYNFDKLVIASGSKPAIPAIQGIDAGRKNGKILTCKNYHDAELIVQKAENIKSVIVVGAGYIGSELAEQFSSKGVQTTLIDALPHILGNEYDADVISKAEDEFKSHGVTLALNQKVVAFHQNTGRNGVDESQITAVTELGSYNADLVIMGVGLIPNTSFISSQLHTLGYGAIIVDDFMRASNVNGEILTNVFAAGDCATVHFNPTDSDEYRPLVSSALRQGILTGKNIAGPVEAYMGTQGTTAVKLYDMCLASSGLTLERAKRRHINAASTTITTDYRSSFMPANTPVTATLIWRKSGVKQILGAQFAAKHDISMAADLISAAIQANFTVRQLAGLDQFYQPNFSKPINFISEVASKALTQGK